VLAKENQLGYKMVKWIKEISFIRSEKEVVKEKETRTKTTSILICYRTSSRQPRRTSVNSVEPFSRLLHSKKKSAKD
jgi:DMSO/TMAO reductase YedYZ molybdopterin-dependent catalytic subunit